MTNIRTLSSQHSKTISPIVLAAVFSFSALCPARAATPLAFLTDVAGSVQIVRGGKTLAGKTGAPLFAGDKVRVIKGRGTVFSATAAPQTVTAGKQVAVGAAGTTSAPSVWKSVFNGMSGGFSRRVSKVPATMRPGSLLALAPVNSKVLPGELSFAWSFGKIDADKRANYEVSIRDDAGFAWRGHTKANQFTYPASAPPLQPGHRYFWTATPQNADGEPNDIDPTQESWFEIATAAEAAALKTDSEQLKTFLKTSPDTLPIAQAALLSQRGFNDAAVALLEPLAEKAGSARSTALDTLFRDILIQSKRDDQLARWYPNEVQLTDRSNEATVVAETIELPSPALFIDRIPDSAFKKYDDPGGTFKLSLPLSWGATRMAFGANLWVTSFASQTGSKPDMSIFVAPTNTLAEKSLWPVLLPFFQKNGEFTAQPATDITFQGQPARKTEWTWQIKPAPTRGYTLEFTRGDNTYFFSIGHLQTETPEAEAAFHQAEFILPTLSTEGVVAPAPSTLTFPKLSAEMNESMAVMDDIIKAQSKGKHPEEATPKTVAEAQAQFNTADTARLAAKPGTLERADGATLASVAATNTAWLLWDGGQRDDAAKWFEKRDNLQRESRESRHTYYEAAFAATQAHIDELLAQTVDLNLSFALCIDINGWLNVQNGRNTLLLNAAHQSGDSKAELAYAQRELSLRQQALNSNFLADETPAMQYARRAYIASGIETVASAQQNLAAYSQAEKSYKLALDWRQSLPASYSGRALDYSMRGLAYLYFITGDNVQAREWYQKSLTELEASAPQLKAETDAITDDNLRLLTQTNNAQTYALIYNNLGILAEGSGDLAASEDWYNKAIKVMEPLAQTGFAGWTRASMMSTSLGNIATLRSDSGEIDEGIKLGDQVIATRRALNDDEGTAFWLLNRSGLLDARNAKGDAEEARSGAEQALRLFESSRRLALIVNANVFLAKLQSKAGNFAAAEPYSQQALKTARSLGSAESIAIAARSLARTEFELARLAKDPAKKAGYWKNFDALILVASDADTRLGAPLSIASTLYIKANGLAERGKLADALEAYKGAISRLEAVRSTARSQDSFADTEDSYRYYQSIVLLLLKMNKADEAFDYLSRARSLKMQANLRLSSIQTKDKGLQTLLDLAGTLQKKLGTVRAQLQTERAKPSEAQDAARIDNLQGLAASTQAEFFKVSDQIKAKNPNFDKVLTVKPRELKKAQRAIPDDTVLVQYAPLGEQLYIFVVTRDELKIYTPKVNPDDLWKEVRAYRAAIDKAQTDLRNGKPPIPVESDPAFKSTITSLYSMLITPIESDIKEKTNIAFIPTGMLYYLPIHALAKETPQGLHYLIEDKHVAYLAAADVLSVVQTRDEGQFGSGMLALGDPSGANLPAARQEVQDIAKIYPASRALTGEGATKQVLQDAANLHRRILHLATHGVLDGANPEASYIQLAGSGEEGKLRMGEVYGLSLNQVDLVTLSACQTALGQKDPDGSEITSLAEAFSSAGPPSVMASLWSVEDESTRQLMETFYTKLAGGKSKGESLQQAQLGLLKNKDTSHPFFWAPFELLGDWR